MNSHRIFSTLSRVTNHWGFKVLFCTFVLAIFAAMMYVTWAYPGFQFGREIKVLMTVQMSVITAINCTIGLLAGRLFRRLEGNDRKGS